MKLSLDDIRPCPDGCTHARSVNRAIKLLERHDCTHASLDHDLCDYAEDGGDDFKVVLWMAEHGRWPSEGIRIHSGIAGRSRGSCPGVDRRDSSCRLG